MNPERWTQLKGLFLRALNVPAREREAFVRRECDGDEELYVECTKLCAKHDERDSFLEPPSADEWGEWVGPDSLVGRRLGDFELYREIGRGGMGVVYLAAQQPFGRDVAVKVLPRGFGWSTGRVERFRNEAMAVSRLEHPGIVPVLAFGHDEGVHYFAMEYVRGQSLDRLLDDLRDGGARDLADPHVCAGVAEEIARALHHCHGNGIIHRDIKPQNVLIDERGTTRVVDFGLAKDEGAESLSKSGDVTGTPHYMSPEQALARRHEIDHRTDVYSVGAVLYEMLTLSTPFQGATSQEVFYRITTSTPRPPRRLNADVPVALATICMKALRRDVEARYASAADLADDLRRFLDGGPIEARPPTFAERAQAGLVGRRSMLMAVPSAALVGSLGMWGVGRRRARASERGRAPRLAIRLEGGRPDAEVELHPHGASPDTFGPAVPIGRTEGGRFEARVDPGLHRIVVRDDLGATAELLRRFEPGSTSDVLARTRRPEDACVDAAVIAAGEFPLTVDATDAETSGFVRFEADLGHDAFCLERKTVTNREYEDFVLSTERPAPRTWPGGPSAGWEALPREDWHDLPVTGITWYDARDYAEWRGMRLPTQLEWERAMKGLVEWPAPFLAAAPSFNVGRPADAPWMGAPLSRMGGYIRSVEPAAQAKGHGPHRMHHPIGNVLEWVESPYLFRAGGSWVRQPGRRLAKGTHWHDSRDRVASRPFGDTYDLLATESSADIGLRCAKSLFPMG